MLKVEELKKWDAGEHGRTRMGKRGYGIRIQWNGNTSKFVILNPGADVEVDLMQDRGEESPMSLFWSGRKEVEMLKVEKLKKWDADEHGRTRMGRG